MKILIGGASSKFFHLNEFGDALERNGVEYKLVSEVDYVSGFPDRRPSKWFPDFRKFNELIKNFSPDIVFCDSPFHFAHKIMKSNIPLYLHLRGDFWKEIGWGRQTLYKTPKRRFALWWRARLAEKCFCGADKILPICKFLKEIVQNRYPTKTVEVLYGGIDHTRWYPVEPMELKHPAIGLLQGAHIWGKTIEMLTLKDVIKEMKDVNFYWAGDGPYLNNVLDVLGKFENFHWLGNLEYPDRVREYLAGIDVYALISGIDNSPLTLQEAALMEKPTVATNAGGIPELMVDGKSGYLVRKGNSSDIKEKISILLSDQNKANKMGQYGRKFVIENFNWDKIAKDFLNSIDAKN